MQDRLPLVALYEPIPGKSISLNLALEVARGHLIVFTDDDVEPSPVWISSLHTAAKRYTAYSIFCGPILPVYPGELPTWLRDFLSLSASHEPTAFSKFLLSAPEGPTNAIPFGPNFAVRAQALEDIRFDCSIGPQRDNYPMGEETDLLARLRGAGERVIYLPSASVRHIVREDQIDPQWILGRAYRFGRGQARLGRIHASHAVGAIWKIWLKFLITWVISHFGVGREFRYRLKAQADLYFLRGILHESRIISKELRKDLRLSARKTDYT
jgi:GT2 family glycosyltransferase